MFGLFRRPRPKPPTTPNAIDPGGPLGLRPGDHVGYYRERYRVAGGIGLTDGPSLRYQYLLETGEGERRILSAKEKGEEIQLSLQDLLPLEDAPEPAAERLTRDGVLYALARRGSETTFTLGAVPPEKTGTVEVSTFVDGHEETTLVLERWGRYVEFRRGEMIHEGEIQVERGNEEQWEVKPPPVIDPDILARERFEKEREEAEVMTELQRRSLEEARAKLAALPLSEEDDSPLTPFLLDDRPDVRETAQADEDQPPRS